jgi:hypothetical protein
VRPGFHRKILVSTAGSFMTQRFLLCGMLLLAGICPQAQVRLPVQAFHLYTQQCNVLGAINEDHVLELFADSGFMLTKYRSGREDFYNTQRCWYYTGAYHQQGDTIYLVYKESKCMVKYPSEPAIKLSSGALVKLSALLPTRFLQKEQYIKALDFPFPTLSAADVGIGVQLRIRFLAWGTGHHF